MSGALPWRSVTGAIGQSPLIALTRIAGDFGAARNNVLLAKFEGSNPAGSVKDRTAARMILKAEQDGRIRPGDTLVEATSGNTGVALAMVCAARGYHLIVILPEGSSQERQQTMRAYGATVVATARAAGMEGARDLADAMVRDGKAYGLDQFSNPANPAAHYETTGPEIWDATAGRITHFVSAMGTTGTMVGAGGYLRSRKPSVQLIGVQPAEGACVPGIRAWPTGYMPTFFDPALLDRTVRVAQEEAEDGARRLALEEGLFCGPSTGGAFHAALRLIEEVRDAVVVFIACDRGDRYLSTPLFRT